MIPELFGHCLGNIILDSYHSNQIVSYTKILKKNLKNLFISNRTSCCHKICLKCLVLSKIAFNFTFNISGWGTLIPNILSL